MSDKDDEPIIGIPPPISEQQWDEFRKTGLLWWVNRQLQLFGWSLCVEVDPEDPGKTLRAYPIKSTYRGFGEDAEERGFKALTTYLRENVADLAKITDQFDPPSLENDTTDV